MLQGISPLLNQFFMEELNDLISKYNKISLEEEEAVEKIFKIVERVLIGQHDKRNFNKLMELSRKLVEYNEEEIELYLWVESRINKNITIEEIRYYNQELQGEGYIRIDDTLIFIKDSSLKSFVREELEDMLDSSYHVDRLFDKDMIIDMWIEGTDKEAAIRDLMSTDDYLEILDTNPDEAYISSNGNVIMYAELEL